MAPADPRIANEEARKSRDQQIQEQRLAMDQSKLAADAEAEAKEQAEKDAKLARSQSSASFSLSKVLDQIDAIDADARDNNGWGETGATGQAARAILPAGSAGYDLAANLQTIDANSAFAALQQMRDNSPTGGALGQVTEKELDLLKSQVANLDPNQSQEQFLANLAIARNSYLDMLRRVDPQTADAYIAAKTPDQGGQEAPQGQGGLTGVVTDDSAPTDTPPPSGGGGGVMSDIATGVTQSAGDVVQAGGDMLGLVINPAHAAINAVAGTELTTDFGSFLRDDLLGISHGNPVAEMMTRGATSAATGGLLARGAASMMNPGYVRNALATVGNAPGIDAAAGAAAGLGGELGRRSGVPGGEIIGTLAGGLGGAGAASRLASGSAPRQMNALAQAADRQGVDLLPADAGGRVSQMVTSGAKASPISASPVVKAAQRGQEQMRGAVNRVRDNAGEALETDDAGNAIRNAAQNFSRQTSQRGSQLYDRANEMARGVRIKPNTAMQTLDSEIARLSELGGTNGPLIKSLTTLRDDIANGVSVRGLRDARTSLSQGTFDGKLRSTQEKQIYRNVLEALSNDIDAGLRSVGRENAANAFKRADEFWKQRVEHIDEVLQPILGNGRSGEDIVKTIETMARGGQGGNARLSRLLANMTEQEAGNVRATVVDRLGKATPGAQDAAGEVFSPATFLTNWNKMTPQAKASLFSDKAMRANLDDIAKLAEGMKTSQSMANHSNTALAIGSNVGAGVAVGSMSPLAVALGAGAQYLTGRLMASPKFARLLARTAKMEPRQAQRTFTEQLGILATREPALAMDAKALQQHLAQSFGQSPMRAAAGEKEQN